LIVIIEFCDISIDIKDKLPFFEKAGIVPERELILFIAVMHKAQVTHRNRLWR